jgi:hypothetical protein
MSGEVKFIFQSIEVSMGRHVRSTGDGTSPADYPTPGGTRVERFYQKKNKKQKQKKKPHMEGATCWAY